jgi:hypothetical protein
MIAIAADERWFGRMMPAAEGWLPSGPNDALANGLA